MLSRPDARGLVSDEWDENVADLQYRDVGEYAVGHNVAADGDPTCVRTCWIPDAKVERVAPVEMRDVTLGMDALAALQDGADAKAKLMPLVEQYREWIRGQQSLVPGHARKTAGDRPRSVKPSRCCGGPYRARYRSPRHDLTA